MTRRIDKPDTDTDTEIRDCLSKATSFVMVAGAGSGKTTSLIKALDYIGKTFGEDLRMRGQRVACITYTEVAVKEIWGDVGHDPLFHVSTIHSFLWDLVKSFQSDIKAWVCQRIDEKLAELVSKGDNFGPRIHQKTRDKNQRDIAKYKTRRAGIHAVGRFTYEPNGDYLDGVLGHSDIIAMAPTLIKDWPLLAKIAAQKYPFFFVDESQDTFPHFIDALKIVDKQERGQFCLGFFGDPMQKIYLTGIGDIVRESGWAEIKKPENFRCPTTVLSVINNIRAKGDGFQQTRGRKEEIDGESRSVEGTARLFILPTDEHRDQNLRLVRKFLAHENQDPFWLSDETEADVKVLVIEHRMAAKHLGFPDLHEAFSSGTPESFKAGFREGTFWALQPFQKVLLPLVNAFVTDQQFDVMQILRANSPLLDKEYLKGVDNPAALLSSLKESVCKLAKLLSREATVSVSEVLKFAQQNRLMRLDERLSERLNENVPDILKGLDIAVMPEVETEDAGKTDQAFEAYFSCAAAQLWGYQTYIEDKSPYSTQQGIKGAEFERVLVVLDDEESKHYQFSYDMMLGIKPLSNKDKEKQDEKIDTAVERTRRLFYVCCSRAVRDLAVVFFSADVQVAVEKWKEAEIFEPLGIKILEDLTFSP